MNCVRIYEMVAFYLVLKFSELDKGLFCYVTVFTGSCGKDILSFLNCLLAPSETLHCFDVVFSYFLFRLK